MNGDISYSVFKESVFILVNDIRKVTGSDPYSFEKFDNGWQYRIIGHERYKTAYSELLNLIFGWW